MATSRIIIIAIFVFLIVAVSISSTNASLVLNFRKVIRLAPTNTSAAATQNSPLPSPLPSVKESNSSAGIPGKEKPKDPQVKNNSTGSQSHEDKKKGDDTKHSQLGPNESCDGLTKSCRIPKTMFACVQTSEEGSKELVILVENERESTLVVNIISPSPVDNALKAFEIASHHTKKINITVTEGNNNKIVLNADDMECVIYMAPTSMGKNIFYQLSFYSKQVTPIYGLYLLFLVALIFGGIWSCCKLRKRRWEGGSQYQELEMGLPESTTVVNAESAEGWDEVWDDDWDDDDNKAVKSPGERHVGSISANGLTSRSSSNKRDGWEGDWEN